MSTRILDFSKIRKRKIALENSLSDNEDSSNLYRIAMRSIKENQSTKNLNVEKFFQSCTDSYNANKYYNHCLSIMEKESDNPQLSDKLLLIFSDQIIPSVTNLDGLKDNVMKKNLPEKMNTEILSSIKEYKISDRVLKNSKSISKRFDLEKIIKEKQYFPLYESVFDCCELLDTYDMPLYGKMNLALEQFSYYLQKNAIEYDRKDLSSLVTEYYLMSNKSFDTNDITRCRSVLEDNMFLNKEDIDNNPMIKMNTSPILKLIDSYKLSSEKSLENLKLVFESLFNLQIELFVKEFDSIILFIRDLFLLSSIDIKDLILLLDGMMNMIKENCSYEQLEILYNQLQLEIYSFEKVNGRIEDGDSALRADAYMKAISEISNQIKYCQSMMYSGQKIEDDIDFMSCKESVEPVYLNEFKIFKFQNLIRATLEIDKFLNRKGNRFVNAIKSKSKKIFNGAKKFWNESNDISGCINSDHCFDLCIAVYEVTNEDHLKSMHQTMNEMCKVLNKNFDLPETSRISYYNIDNRFEIHLEDATYIIMNESEEELLEKSISEYDMMNCVDIIYIESVLSKYDSFIHTFDKNLIMECTIASECNIDRLLLFIEATQYSECYSKNDIKYMIDSYAESCNDFSDNTRLYNAYYNWEPRKSSFDIELEATKITSQVLNEKVDLNSLKLSIEGIKKKAKQLSSKEQEMSRDLDSAMTHFYNSMKSGLTTDRREAIIKGSIIPSFSRCIKIAIGLAGIAAFTDPVYAAIAAFVGFAISKNLTRKERSLLLDEIDIELKALDKEIQIADNNNNMKKYRQLITYQKKLQREKQRIKYNIKIGKDLPDSSVGTAYSKD